LIAANAHARALEVFCERGFVDLLNVAGGYVAEVAVAAVDEEMVALAAE
jgi:hypothetical protein